MMTKNNKLMFQTEQSKAQYGTYVVQGTNESDGTQMKVRFLLIIIKKIYYYAE